MLEFQKVSGGGKIYVNPCLVSMIAASAGGVHLQCARGEANVVGKLEDIAEQISEASGENARAIVRRIASESLSKLQPMIEKFIESHEPGSHASEPTGGKVVYSASPPVMTRDDAIELMNAVGAQFGLTAAPGGPGGTTETAGKLATAADETTLTRETVRATAKKKP